MKSKTKKASEKFADETVETNEHLAGRIAAAIELDSRIKQAKAELDVIKSEFMEMFKDPSTSQNVISTSAGTVTLKLANSYGIDIEFVPELKKTYKKEFDVYVNEKITYSPTTAMRNKLSDGDYRHKDLIRNAVTIKETPSVVFTAAVANVASKVQKTKKTA